MNLRTGESVWRSQRGPVRTHLPLEANTACEVAIVGGGITGALAAYELVKAGFDCVLIDAREMGAGSTSASTALLSYELDLTLTELSERIGEEEAVACYRACHAAIGTLGDTVRELGEEVALRPRESLYVTESEERVAVLRTEFALRQRHGLEVEFLERTAIEGRFAFSRPAALLTARAAEVDVVALTDALLRSASRRGLRLFSGTRLSSQTWNGRRILLRTQQGCEIAARKLVFATGYESEKYLGRKIGTLHSTYALATKPLPAFPGWDRQCLIWTDSHPYIYLRTTPDGRAIIGGGDVPFENAAARDALIPEKTRMLEEALRSFFPRLAFETGSVWAGTFGETPESLARIGESPEVPGAIFAMGFGGNGVIYSTIAAGIIRDACMGRDNANSRLFRLDR